MRTVFDIPEICVSCAKNGVIRRIDQKGRVITIPNCTYIDTVRDMTKRYGQPNSGLTIRCGFRLESRV